MTIAPEVRCRPERDPGLDPVRQLHDNDVARTDASRPQRSRQRASRPVDVGERTDPGPDLRVHLEVHSPIRASPSATMLPERGIAPPAPEMVVLSQVAGYRPQAPPVRPRPCSTPPHVLLRPGAVARATDSPGTPEVHCHSRRTSLSFANMALLEPATNDAGRGERPRVSPDPMGRVVRETAEASSFVLDVPEDLVPTSPMRPGNSARSGCGWTMSRYPVLLDVVVARRGRRTPGHGEANPRRRGLQLDERPPRRGDFVEVARPAGFFQLGPAPGRPGGIQRRKRHHPVLSLLKTALATTSAAGPDRSTPTGIMTAIIHRSEIDALCAIPRRAF